MPPLPEGRRYLYVRKATQRQAKSERQTRYRKKISCQSTKCESQKKLCTLLDLCVSSLRRGHANLLCTVPILTDDPRRESRYPGILIPYLFFSIYKKNGYTLLDLSVSSLRRGHANLLCIFPYFLRWSEDQYY